MEAVLSRKEKGGEEAAAAMALSYKTLGGNFAPRFSPLSLAYMGNPRSLESAALAAQPCSRGKEKGGLKKALVSSCPGPGKLSYAPSLSSPPSTYPAAERKEG